MPQSDAMDDYTRRLLSMSPQIVNIGLELFAEALTALHVPVVHVEWRPPAQGDVRLAELLRRLEPRFQSIEAANAEALARLVSGEPTLVDCRPAC